MRTNASLHFAGGLSMSVVMHTDQFIVLCRCLHLTLIVVDSARASTVG